MGTVDQSSLSWFVQVERTEKGRITRWVYRAGVDELRRNGRLKGDGKMRLRSLGTVGLL